MNRRITANVIRSESDEKRSRFVVSTSDVARDGHVVDQQTWILDGYRSNPVVLWAHDYDLPPVGRAVEIGVEDGRLMATVEWDTDSELGAQVARQYANGFLHTVSVGWRSGTVTPRRELPEEHPAHGPTGLFFRDNEMLEFSAVPVPSDPGALIQRGLPAPRVELMSLEEVCDWSRANAPTVGTQDILRALKDPKVRDEIVSIVWAGEPPGSEGDAAWWRGDDGDDDDSWWG